MRPADKINELIKKLQLKASADLDRRVHEDISRALTEPKKTESALPEPNIWRIIMKSRITKLAAAAVVMIACVIGLSLWKTTGSGIALADVLARIEKVKAYRYQWFRTGEEPNKPYSFLRRATTLSSQEYGSKTTREELDPNGGWSTFQEGYRSPDNKTAIIIWPKQKKYGRVEFDDVTAERMWEVSSNDPRTFLKRILACKYESMGRATIDGIEVEGFQTTDPNFFYSYIGDRQIGDVNQIDVKVWVDAKTRLPVRYDYMGDKRNRTHFVMQDFQWDVPVDAADFEPVIPDDYTGTVVKLPDVTEETAIQGLKLWVELLGKYPEKSPIEADFADVGDTVLRLAEKSETPAAMRLKEEIKGLTDEQIKKKLADFLMPIRALGRFYGLLQWDKKDPEYYGKIVIPKDADKVLMRWKVSDNEYRVIFGDLHTQTVTAEALAKLEKNLPK
jgi:hypothetical protein